MHEPTESATADIKSVGVRAPASGTTTYVLQSKKSTSATLAVTKQTCSPLHATHLQDRRRVLPANDAHNLVRTLPRRSRCVIVVQEHAELCQLVIVHGLFMQRLTVCGFRQLDDPLHMHKVSQCQNRGLGQYGA